MSRNYYYVLTYNISNKVVRAMLDRCHLLESQVTMVDFKIRSRFFPSFAEATSIANDDFLKKLRLIYPDQASKGAPEDLIRNVKSFSIYNPKFHAGDESVQQLLEQFNGDFGPWDDACVGSLFFCEMPSENQLPDTWMFKYEIYAVDLAIESAINGEQIFRPTASYEFH